MQNNYIFAIRNDSKSTNDFVSNEQDISGTVIRSLYIKNYALIDELEVSFDSGLNILTGQTGAGKSIIIGALNAVLGERADTENVREGAQKAIVEAVILTGAHSDPVVAGLLNENGVEVRGDEIILRREIRPAGSRAFINDTPVTISLLRAVGDRLVDLHGQHDHQLLLKEDHHREVIDALASVQKFKKEYIDSYEEVRNLRREWKGLQKKEQELQEKMELFKFQLRELENVDLDEESYQEMESEMNRLDNAEELDQKAAMIIEIGTGNEESLLNMLSLIANALDDMVEIEQEFSTYSGELKQARISIQELLAYTERYRSNIEFNPARLEELRRKQSDIRRMEKKYSRSLTELLMYRDELKESVNLAENFDLELDKLKKKLDSSTEILKRCAISLHEARISAGSDLESNISVTLSRLGIPNNRFEVKVSWRENDEGWINIDGTPVGCHNDGPDDVAYYISTNKGESPRPLARIASGGEVSRVMLAMKSVIAREQHLPVMIFDEIDTGISGAVAERVGITMQELAQQCQIIAITHQAQIAGQADHHFKVEKHEMGDRTISSIRLLNDEEHIEEIASIISGAEISDHAIASAREMVGKARSG